MNRKSARLIIRGTLFMAFIAIAAGCRKPVIEGSWKVISYGYDGSKDTLQNTIDTESYYSKICHKLFTYQKQTKEDTSIMDFDASGEWSWNHHYVTTTIASDEVDRDCSLEYKTIPRDSMVIGKWKLADDKKSVLIVIDHSAAINAGDYSGPPVQIGQYYFGKGNDNEIYIFVTPTLGLNGFTLIRN